MASGLCLSAGSDTEEILRRLEEIEKRLARLEGARAVGQTPIPDEKKKDDKKKDDKKKDDKKPKKDAKSILDGMPEEFIGHLLANLVAH